MFAKKKLSVAVAFAAGSMAMGGMQAAQADSVFFPYISGSDTVTSIVSVINTSSRNYEVSGNGNYLQYTMYFKQAPNAENDDVCNKIDTRLPTSKNDIQTIDITDRFGTPGDLGVLFDDPSVNNQWMQAGRNYALAKNRTPFRGYLVVDNAASERRNRTGEPTLTGEAFMFEFANGSAWGYQAYHQVGDDNPSARPYRGSEFDYEFAASASPSTVNMMPFDEFDTSFLVTPINIIGYTAPSGKDGVDENMRPQPTNYFQAEIDLQSPNRETGTFALYDRDEVPVSGTTPQRVTCVGKVAARDLLSPGTADAELLKGGWGYIVNRRTNVIDQATGNPLAPADQPQYPDYSRGYGPRMAELCVEGSDDSKCKPNYVRPGAVVFKLEVNQQATFNGAAAPNSFFNNAVLLRPDPFGTPPQPIMEDED
jgi:hypothetical protein